MTWHKTSRHERGYGAEWDKLRKTILLRDQGLCLCCYRQGRVVPATEVDHIKAKAKGGTDDPSNLEAICHECHKAKTITETGKKYQPRKAIGADGWPI